MFTSQSRINTYWKRSKGSSLGLNEEEVNSVGNRLKTHHGLLETIRDLLDMAKRAKGIEGADNDEAKKSKKNKTDFYVGRECCRFA
ncbi:hypothetical protein [Neochlamydia sp. AcF95]|uniref:hypothetical protein n=1 Tax=Neochlamydia sp. AcF95 TaxID=2795734 RepID=UPI001BC8DF45|nr:hypothetical protein [Neochlamydia sp. AcF95]